MVIFDLQLKLVDEGTYEMQQEKPNALFPHSMQEIEIFAVSVQKIRRLNEENGCEEDLNLKVHSTLLSIY